MALIGRDALGWVALKKISGSGATSIGAQINLPAATASPLDPSNRQYPDVINLSDDPTVYVDGPRTPTFAISTFLKASWFSANLMNSLIITLDSDYLTDLWSICVNDKFNSTVFDDARCTGVSLSQSAMGGPIYCSFTFNSKYGYANLKSPQTTFSTPGSSDSGALLSRTSTTCSVSGVTSWSLNIGRAQIPYLTLNGDDLPDDIVTGRLGGTFSITQGARETAPTTSATLTFGGVTTTMNFSNDNKVRPYDPTTFGIQTNQYTLLGSSAISFA